MEGTDHPTVRRPAWVEIDLTRLRANWQRIRENRPKGLKVCWVVKDNAYGHGAVELVRALDGQGIDCLAVTTLDEAMEIRQAGCGLPILMLGERMTEELPYCVEHDFTCCVNQSETLDELVKLSVVFDKTIPFHLKVDTGMSRYGVRLNDLDGFLTHYKTLSGVRLEGVMSHFAMSDETDKSFAHRQMECFQMALGIFHRHEVSPACRHLCNSGGFLDLPDAHWDMVRVGILLYGVYPSQVCRRIEGIQPVLSVHCRIAAIQSIQAGDNVGYGLRYQAKEPRRIGVLPIGYGDGYPRVRNEGWVLIQGRRASIVGANAMDATMVDLTEIPSAQIGDRVVVMGESESEALTVHDLARFKKTVSYEVLTAWRARLPRIWKT